jgi:hypothetical protein
MLAHQVKAVPLRSLQVQQQLVTPVKFKYPVETQLAVLVVAYVCQLVLAMLDQVVM